VVTTGSAIRRSRLTRAPGLLASLALLTVLGCGASTGSPSSRGLTASPAPLASAPATAGATSSAAVSAGTGSTIPSTSAGAPLLMVLGGSESSSGVLLVMNEGGAWSEGMPDVNATSIARDGSLVTIARRDGLEVRDVAHPQADGTFHPIGWGMEPETPSPVGVDMSDTGKAVIALGTANGLVYLVAGGRGDLSTLSSLSPSPASPFGPSIAWLDETRVLVLSSDSLQVSRIAVVDSASRTVTSLRGLAGVRAFALSPDRRMIGAATESGVYVGKTGDWLAGKEPILIYTAGESQIVWGLAFDGSGSRLAFFSGDEDANGTVTDAHDLGLRTVDGSWQSSFDLPVPLVRPINQVWLS
jgi:hypothetical protein